MNVCVMIKTVAVVSLGVISPHLIRSSSLLQFTEFNINNFLLKKIFLGINSNVNKLFHFN